MRGHHSVEVAALQGELDQAQCTAAEKQEQLLAARCDLEELEANARGVHRSLQVGPKPPVHAVLRWESYAYFRFSYFRV